MHSKTKKSVRPRPVTVDTLAEGAGISPKDNLSATISYSPAADTATSAGSLMAFIRSIIASAGSPDLLEFANLLLGLSLVDKDGNPRIQYKTEIIVVTVSAFDRHLQEHGSGAVMINGLPHVFTGTHWHLIEEGQLKTLLGEFAERIGNIASDSRHYDFRDHLLKQSHSALLAEVALNDPNQVLINFQNGTLVIDERGEHLRDFDRKDLLTYQLPFAYDEHARCELFDNYLTRVLPDISSQKVLAEFFGWIFVKNLKLEKVLVLYGDGHNGKSVLFDVVNALLDEQNVSNIGLSSLSKMENRFRLSSALLNFGSEISDRCEADLFKKLASGEPVEARRLYKDSYTIRNYARLAFNANVLPKNTEQTAGFFRRFLIVPFTQTITEEEKDPDLASKIIAGELAGVFNWVMHGFRCLRANREFTICDAATDALAAYRRESDSVEMFLEDQGLVSSVDGRLGKSDLYIEYRSYCQSSGYCALSKNNFGKRLVLKHRITDSKSGSLRFWHLTRHEDDE